MAATPINVPAEILAEFEASLDKDIAAWKAEIKDHILKLEHKKAVEPKIFFNHAHDRLGHFARGSSGFGTGRAAIGKTTGRTDVGEVASDFKTKVNRIIYLTRLGHTHEEIVKQTGLPSAYVKGVVAAHLKKEGGTGEAGPIAKRVKRLERKEQGKPEIEPPPKHAPGSKGAMEQEIDSMLGPNPGGDRRVNFDNVDISNVRDIHKAMTRLSADFPDLAHRLKYIGADPANQKDVDSLHAYAQYIAHSNTINLNAKYYDRPAYLTGSVPQHMRDDMRLGFHPTTPRGTEGMSVFVHEFGHHVDMTISYELVNKVMLEKNPKKQQALLKKFEAYNAAKAAVPHVSNYAKTNDLEHAAEAFAAGHLNPERYPEAAAFVKLQQNLMKEIYAGRKPSGVVAPKPAPAPKPEPKKETATSLDFSEEEASKHWARWEKDLHPKDKEAVDMYRGAMYESVNNALRNGGRQSGEVQILKQRLDRAIASGNMPRAATVYRGVDIDLAKSLKVGSTFEDKGFVSTTITPKVADWFTGENKNGSIMHITVPKHAHAGYIPLENELILPRGSTFRVTKIEGRHIHMEME